LPSRAPIRRSASTARSRARRMARRAPRPSTAPRRVPLQPRARVTRDVMLVAAERVLARLGAAGLTTNHVAEVAGVSIGTLYQYFPNKQAIVAALIERNSTQFAELVTRVLRAHPTSAPEVVAFELALGL